MRKIKSLVHAVGLAVVIVFGASLSANATITLQLANASTLAEPGFQFDGSAGATIESVNHVGLYEFNSTGSDGPQNPFWSVCLSPSGNLDNNAHNYSSLSFTAGALGNNPASWATGTEVDAGIQNAQYLWRLLSPAVIASGNADQGAGLALAIYTALYDSTGYGAYTYSVNSGPFYVTAGLSGAVATAWANDLASLNSAAVSANLGNGYVLRSTDLGAGQDLLWNVNPIPEPTTIIAGALLLLPFGASTLRVLRKSRTA